jgi:hypothetical protein
MDIKIVLIVSSIIIVFIVLVIILYIAIFKSSSPTPTSSPSNIPSPTPSHTLRPTPTSSPSNIPSPTPSHTLRPTPTSSPTLPSFPGVIPPGTPGGGSDTLFPGQYLGRGSYITKTVLNTSDPYAHITFKFDYGLDNLGVFVEVRTISARGGGSVFNFNVTDISRAADYCYMNKNGEIQLINKEKKIVATLNSNPVPGSAMTINDNGALVINGNVIYGGG